MPHSSPAAAEVFGVDGLAGDVRRANQALGIAAKPDPTQFQPVPIGELLSRQYAPDDYLWEGRLVRGTVSMVAAKPKVGKSTFARNLALAIARGAHFLGLATKQGKVIYLALEERPQDVAAAFKALGATPTDQIYIHAASAPAEAIMALADLLRERKPALVAIDPLFRFARVRDEKAYAEVYGALGPLIDLAREVGTHLLLVHHSGKSAKADAIDSPLGSTALAGAVSTLIHVKRTEAYRTIQTVQRCGQDMPETVLHFEPETFSLSLGGTRVEADRADAEEAILDHLRSCGEPQTRPQIEDAVEGRTGVKRGALKALVASGRVVREGDGKRGTPFLFCCSHPIAGTWKQETRNDGSACTNTGQTLVPGGDRGGILVPDSIHPLNPAPEVEV